MDNTQWLKTYTDALAVIEGDRMIMAGDTNLNFVYMSSAYREIIAAGSNMVGKRLKDTKAPGHQHAEHFGKISAAVKKRRKSAVFFVITRLPAFTEKVALLYQLSPIINPHNEELTGLVGELQFVNPDIIFRMFRLSIPHLSSGAAPEKRIHLTDREQEVLFLLALGHSYKEIAHILTEVNNKNISPNTVNTIIRRQLFKKFSAYSVRNLLIQVAIQHPIDSVPESILNLKDGLYELTFHS